MTWNEQLRPVHPSQVVGNAQFVRDAKEWESTGNYPAALLFVGEPGTGKTSAANALSRTLLGKHYNDMNILWTNASDDRGINYIRDEVKNFVRLSGIGAKRKIVVWDEADGLTAEWEQYYEDVVEYHGGDLRASVAALERIPKTADSIKQFTVKATEEDWWEYTASNEYNDLREHLLTVLHSSGDKLSFMNKFHRAIRKHFDNDADTTFVVMEVWGDMMKYVYEWGGSDESYVDVLVARLKNKMEVKT